MKWFDKISLVDEDGHRDITILIVILCGFILIVDLVIFLIYNI
jgi:hypothetical protein